MSGGESGDADAVGSTGSSPGDGNTAGSLADAVSAVLGPATGGGARVSVAFGQPVVEVPSDQWTAALAAARDGLGATFFDWLTGVDELDDGYTVTAHVCALAGGPTDKTALMRGEGVLIKTRIPNDRPVLPTATGVYRGANWHERETAEMFGIEFEGHPNPVPLLLPDGFEGHPLRKDFILAARVAKAWPGAKEPGESDHDRRGAGGAGGGGKASPGRRRMLPPGIPGEDWLKPLPVREEQREAQEQLSSEQSPTIVLEAVRVDEDETTPEPIDGPSEAVQAPRPEPAPEAEPEPAATSEPAARTEITETAELPTAADSPADNPSAASPDPEPEIDPAAPEPAALTDPAELAAQPDAGDDTAVDTAETSPEGSTPAAAQDAPETADASQSRLAKKAPAKKTAAAKKAAAKKATAQKTTAKKAAAKKTSTRKAPAADPNPADAADTAPADSGSADADSAIAGTAADSADDNSTETGSTDTSTTDTSEGGGQ
ncbi:MAG TPA: NADH-quinone oxidoreductase subunit C [Actinocrinis sp.]